MERVLGFDLGSRTLGVAVSDPLGMIARTVETFRFEEDDYDAALRRAGELIKEYSAKRIVLGLPKHMNGDIGIRGEISIKFKASLEEMYKIPVELVDERLTTVAAHKMLISADVSRKKRKQVVDQIAAVQILQGYLDRH